MTSSRRMKLVAQITSVVREEGAKTRRGIIDFIVEHFKILRAKLKGKNGFTRPQIAKMFKVTETIVYDWDKGRSAPPIAKGKDGEEIVYSEDMRTNGDMDSLQVLVEAYKPIKHVKDALSGKHNESYREDSLKHNTSS